MEGTTLMTLTIKINKMKNRATGRTILIISGILIIAIGMIGMLALKANDNEHTNFHRKFLNGKLEIIKTIPVKDKIICAVGSYGGNMYFKTDTTGKLLVVDKGLTIKSYLRLPYDTTFGNKHSFDYEVEGSKLYFYLPNGPSISTYDFINKQTNVYKKIPCAYTRATKINNDNFLFRGLHKSVMRDQIFFKISLSNDAVTLENKVSPLKYDFGIGSDGQLHYDSITKRTFYIEFFQPDFLCIDSTLNLAYSGRTIDNSPSIEMVVRNQKKESEDLKVYKSTTPKKMINAYSEIAGKYLFVLSRMKSENEEREEFSNNLPVDVYHTSNGEYSGSFYVPNWKKERAKGFSLKDNILTVFYKSSIVSYDFSKMNNILK